MDIRITKLVVPARSRNGRVYTGSSNITVNNGSGGGGSTSHPRLHSVTDPLDHAAADASDYDKALGSNATTGALEWFAKLWKRVGAVISPATAGDYLYVAATGAVQAIYGACTGAVNSVGVRGSTDSGFGVYGTSGTSYGVVGNSTSGGGGYFYSTSGKGGIFTSNSNIALEATGYAGPVVAINTAGSTFNTDFNLLRLKIDTTGTAAAGLGSSIDFHIEQASGASSNSAAIVAILTDVTSVTSAFIWRLRNAGGAIAEVMRLSGAGVLNVLTGFSVGGTPAVADGTYTVGIGPTTNGTITTRGGIITAVTQAS